MRLLPILPLLLLTPSTLALALALPSSPAPRSDDRNRALYILDNNPAGSSIISLKISNDDGTLSSPVLTSTGGVGMFGQSAGGGASGPDSLFGADALVVSGDYLFTVNAGSNTVSMFLIDKDDPWHPKLIGAPAPSGGDFPMAVAYSPKIKTLCVLNGGAKSGISCLTADHKKGLHPTGPLRPLPAVAQTTPPLGPPGTTSDLTFNPSQTALFATVKGVPGTTLGSLYAFPVREGAVAATGPVTRIPGVPLDFSMTFLGGDAEVLVTDPSFGGAILAVAPDFSATEKTHIAVPGQVAICWSAYAARFDSAFLIDAGRGDVTVVDPDTGAVKGHVGVSTPGVFDAVVERRWLYALGADASVVVVGLGDGEGVGKEVQKADLSGVGRPRKGWMGVAVYPS